MSVRVSCRLRLFSRATLDSSSLVVFGSTDVGGYGGGGYGGGAGGMYVHR